MKVIFIINILKSGSKVMAKTMSVHSIFVPILLFLAHSGTTVTSPAKLRGSQLHHVAATFNLVPHFSFVPVLWHKLLNMWYFRPLLTSQLRRCHAQPRQTPVSCSQYRDLQFCSQEETPQCDEN